jgi:hypothetical protein
MIFILQLGLGHICVDDGIVGGPIVTKVLGITPPWRTLTNVVCPCRRPKGPKGTCFGGGLFPPGFTHCNNAVPPDDVRNAAGLAPEGIPIASKWDVKLKLGFFVIVGAPINCGLAANATGDDTMAKAKTRTPGVNRIFLSKIKCTLVESNIIARYRNCSPDGLPRLTSPMSWTSLKSRKQENLLKKVTIEHGK